MTDLYINLLSEASSLGLSADELGKLSDSLKRSPSREEMAICGALWSEHCSYKSSRPHLKRFHTKEKWVLQGPGENAGVYAVNNNWGIAFKMESHNHPSYIEPYQGAATGVGGILRDVFCMGARPIANLNCLRFGHGKWNGHLIKRVVEGIADYGNSVGVPTVTGDTQFHHLYSKNILVNAFTAGFIHKDQIFKGVLTEEKETLESRKNPEKSTWPEKGITGKMLDSSPSCTLRSELFPDGENLLVYFGSATGRDGVHGATMSSAAFSGTSDGTENGIHRDVGSGASSHVAATQALKPTVQVGDPFAEKILLEATMALIESGAMVGLQDMGAAGLTSSSAEMAGRSGCGVAIDLSAVPLRASGMKAWEILLSESQERMLCAVKPKDFERVAAVLQGFEIPYNVIGSVNHTGRFVCIYKNSVHADLPVTLLTDEAPILDLPLVSREEYKKKYHTLSLPHIEEDHLNSHAVSLNLNFTLPDEGLEVHTAISTQNLSMKEIKKSLSSSFKNVIKESFFHPAFCSRKPIFEHYCATVGGQTVLAPGAFNEGSSAIIRLPAECQEEKGDARSDVGCQGIALAAGCSERWVQLDPLEGSSHSTAQVARKIVATGGIARAMTDCLNFGSPRDPYVMRQISDSIDGINRVAKDLSIPVVSGNVSLNNQTDSTPIPPTPMIGIVGDVADVRKVFSSKLGPLNKQNPWADSHAPTREDAALAYHLYAIAPSDLAAYARYEISETSLIWGKTNSGPLPPFDSKLEEKIWTAMRLVQNELVPELCRPVGRGGLYISALRTALESACHFKASETLDNMPSQLAFAEGQTGFLFALKTQSADGTKSTQHISRIKEIENNCGSTLQIIEIGALKRSQNGSAGTGQAHSISSLLLDLDGTVIDAVPFWRRLDVYFDAEHEKTEGL